MEKRSKQGGERSGKRKRQGKEKMQRRRRMGRGGVGGKEKRRSKGEAKETEAEGKKDG